MSEGDLVSCLCVTRNRVAMLQRAVQCFRAQTYAPRELLIVYEDDDAATRAYVRQIPDTDVRAIEVQAQPKQTLGALRNLAVREARGSFIAQWDDDDWSAPERLTAQMQALQQRGKAGCVLLRWLMFDELTHAAWISYERPWEGSLLVRRDILPPYADLPKFEDTPVLGQLVQQGLLAGLIQPELYIYVYHGGNTWERQHWEERIVPNSQRLSPADAQQIRKVLHDRPV